LRCPRCGNENAESNRFCGMCGASLNGVANDRPGARGAGSSSDVRAGGSTSAPLGSTSRQGSAQVFTPPVPTSTEQNLPTAEAKSDKNLPAHDRETYSEPVITGPSFLGLNKPSPRDDGHRKPPPKDAREHLESSRSVDYLLEEEEPPNRGWGKLVLVLLALVLAVGFGYLHWKQGGFDWVTGAKKPAPLSEEPVPGTAPPPSSTPAADSSAGQGSSGATTPAANSNANPTGANQGSADQGSAPQSSSSSSSSAPVASNGSNSQPATPASAPQNSAAESTLAPANQVPPSPGASKSNPTPPPDSGADDSDTEEAGAPEPAAPKPIPRKPSAAVPVDTVTEAERYIYGRGVRQDCDHGLRVLKPATQANAKAMAALGSLYATGTCTPRDLPTAYRWYAMALHKDPDNQGLQNDLQKLWGQMTQPERQLAIKLSQ
jgi:zinc-ribbon domain